MEQAQIAESVEAVTPLGKASTGDLFIFRPLAPPPTPPHAQRPSPRSVRLPPSLFRLRSAPAPAPAVYTNPQDKLHEPDEANFRRLLAQYQMFPAAGPDPAACLHFDLQAISSIYGLIAKSERQALAYEDLYQLEAAVLRVMPEAVLRGEAKGRRARYRALVSPERFRQHMRSKVTPKDDATGPADALRAEMAALLSQTQRSRPGAPSHLNARATAWRVSACWAFGLCVMGGLGFVVIHLASVPPNIAPAVPLLMALTGGAAAALEYIYRDKS